MKHYSIQYDLVSAPLTLVSTQPLPPLWAEFAVLRSAVGEFPSAQAAAAP